MPLTEETYRRVALEDPEGQWELHRGRLREKPAMSFKHNDLAFELGHTLRLQIDPSTYRVRVNAGRVHYTDELYYIPDVLVVPVAFTSQLRDRADLLESYDQPLPLIVEIWSPSTGDYDVNAKLPEYRKRGDLEIWRLHPFERTLTAWRRQPDATYVESIQTGGTIAPDALPGVTIDLDLLFAGS